MTARLIILGLLREKSYYGYELKRTMKERYMDEWTHVAFGSIYYALRQMTQEGLVQPQATEQDGNRPSRTIYAITKRSLASTFHVARTDAYMYFIHARTTSTRNHNSPDTSRKNPNQKHSTPKGCKSRSCRERCSLDSPVHSVIRYRVVARELGMDSGTSRRHSVRSHYVATQQL